MPSPVLVVILPLPEIATGPLATEIALVGPVTPAPICRLPPVPVNSTTPPAEFIETVAPLLATNTGWLAVVPTLPAESTTRTKYVKFALRTVLSTKLHRFEPFRTTSIHVVLSVLIWTLSPDASAPLVPNTVIDLLVGDELAATDEIVTVSVGG